MFGSIAADNDDGLTFLLNTIAVEPIREEQEYGGQRITLMAKLGNSRIPLQIDVGFGDAVTPAAKLVDFPTLLDMASPRIVGPDSGFQESANNVKLSFRSPTG